MSDKQDYFDYVINVLGVKSVVLSDLQAHTNKEADLLFVIESYLNYTADEKDLLGKMIAALKIKQEKIQVVDSSENNSYQAKFKVYFVDQYVKNSTFAECEVKTHSPRFLLKNADFKKEAWADLQKVIQFYKN